MSITITCQRCGKQFDSFKSSKRKFCSASCYQAFTVENQTRKWGDDKAAAEFWNSVELDSKSGCLLWQKAKNRHGYGIVLFNGISQPAHRVAWQLTKGKIPPNHHLHHRPTCSRACCNVEHLELLTISEHSKVTHALGQQDYSKIRFAKGERNGTHTHPERFPRGETHHSAKYTDAQLKEVLDLRAKGLSQRATAEITGIPQQHISRIEKGQTRKSFTRPKFPLTD